MLRPTGETALAGGAVRAFETDPEFSWCEQACFAELATLGGRRSVLGALSRAPGREERPEQRASDGATRHGQGDDTTREQPSHGTRSRTPL
jgi:hypothetical protein